MQRGEDLAAAASSRQHLHLVAVFHRDEGCGNHPRRITQDEVALGLPEHENAVIHRDLAFGQRAVQRRRSRIAQTPRPVFDEQPRQRLVRPARNTEFDTREELVARVRRLEGDPSRS